MRFILLLLNLLLLISVSAEQLQEPLRASKVVDLTHPLYEGMPFWPGTEPVSIKRLVDYDQGYRMHKFTMWENIGTHVDSPSHFAAGKGKQTVDQLPLSKLVVPIIVINVQDKVAINADYVLSVEDILYWEKQHGEIPAATLVIMNTGWYKKFSRPEKYLNKDAQGVLHFPGFSAEAATLLVKRDVAGIGIDTMSLDTGSDANFSVHNIMLAANKYQIENMNNLDELPVTGATAVIGVLPVKDASQAQARIFALIE